MRYFGKTGMKIKRVGFGGIPIQRISQEDTNKVIDELEKCGVNFIDTARGYTVSEEYLGNALKGRREKFYIATKSMSRDYESMKRDIEISLKNLQTDYIDLYQMHNVKPAEYDTLFGEDKDTFVSCCKDFIKDSKIVKLSDEEACLISGMENIGEAAKYIIDLGCENLIITLGKKGALLTTKEKQILIPTNEMKMVDATGAGDAFIGAVIAQVLDIPNKSIEDIIKTANLVGGITTTRIGALESIPTWDEVKQYSKLDQI